MSFSSEVKQELSKVSNLANKKAVQAEWLGYSITNNFTVTKNKMKYVTENEYTINRFAKLLNNMQKEEYKIQFSGKTFQISFQSISLPEIQIDGKNMKVNTEKLHTFLEELDNQKEVMEKALIRGCFLGSGSINNPEKNYHMEILLSKIENAEFLLKLLEEYTISLKILQKSEKYAVYTKDGEEISKFLALIGSNKGVLHFEDIRVLRDMRNDVNRKVNCETANLNKIVDSAIEQMEAIKKIKKQGKYEKLSENLKEIAELRMKNPDASLTELGQMLANPIGKSGVSHRLKAILKIAEE